MNDLRTIRANIDAFLHFLEDRTGRTSSTMIFPPKLIYYFLHMYRNKVTYEDKYIKAKSGQDLNIELTLPCIALKKIDMVECPCAPASGCYFFKSTHPIPKILSGLPNNVSLVHLTKNQKNYGIFTYVDWYNFEDKINSRITAQANQPYYTMKNINSDRHLYVYANVKEYPNLKAVSMSAIFNDPLEVAAFPTCGEKVFNLCSPLDEEFIIEEEIKSKVFELTFNGLAAMRNGSPGVDLFNNEVNETVGNVKA